MCEGRCVVRKASWKPQAKKPAVSSAKSRSASATREAGSANRPGRAGGPPSRRRRPPLDRARDRHDRQHGEREDAERRQRADAADQALRHRHHRRLAERAAGAGQPDHLAPPLRRHRAAHRRQRRARAGAGDAEAGQDADAERRSRRRRAAAPAGASPAASSSAAAGHRPARRRSGPRARRVTGCARPQTRLCRATDAAEDRRREPCLRRERQQEQAEGLPHAEGEADGGGGGGDQEPDGGGHGAQKERSGRRGQAVARAWQPCPPRRRPAAPAAGSVRRRGRRSRCRRGSGRYRPVPGRSARFSSAAARRRRDHSDSACAARASDSIRPVEEADRGSGRRSAARPWSCGRSSGSIPELRRPMDMPSGCPVPAAGVSFALADNQHRRPAVSICRASWGREACAPRMPFWRGSAAGGSRP